MGYKRFDIDPISKKIGVSVLDWPGNCYGISSLCVKHKIVPVGSKLRYGHWTGPIHQRSRFYRKNGLGFVQHGWVELPDKTIFDPTRYVFEYKPPYIYEGPNDFYDVGGNLFRKENTTPPPPFNAIASRTVLIRTDPETSAFIKALLLDLRTNDNYTIEQIYWLANLVPDATAPFTAKIYTALKQADMAAFIPLDNWRLIME